MTYQRKPDAICPVCGTAFYCWAGAQKNCSMACQIAGRKKTPEERFWAKVIRTADCWLWTAAKHRFGYGIFHPTENETVYAHRWSWELVNGPTTQLVLHHCDTPQCVRPDHLFLGNHADNVADKVSKKRHQFGVRVRNAKLTEQQVREIRQRHTNGEGVRALSRVFPVCNQVISDIVRRKTWKHVK